MLTEINNPYMLEGTTENKGGSHPVTWSLAHAKTENAQLAVVFIDSNRAKHFLDTLSRGFPTGITVSLSQGTITFDNGATLRVMSQHDPMRFRGLRLDYSWIELGCSDAARIQLSMSTRGPDMQPWRRKPTTITKRSGHGTSTYIHDNIPTAERIYTAMTGNDWRGLLHIGKAMRQALEQLAQVYQGEQRVGREAIDQCWEWCGDYPDVAECLSQCTGTALDPQLRPTARKPDYPTLHEHREGYKP